MREIKSIEPGPLSGKPPTEIQGPRRRAPMYYAGETLGQRKINYPDVERHANGAMPGIRDKAARRLIRGALKRRFSKVEKALELPRAMQAQAREIANDEGKSTRWARRLFEQELEIHQPVYVPATRTALRANKRAAKDAIAQLVDKMAQP